MAKIFGEHKANILKSKDDWQIIQKLHHKAMQNKTNVV